MKFNGTKNGKEFAVKVFKASIKIIEIKRDATARVKIVSQAQNLQNLDS